MKKYEIYKLGKTRICKAYLMTRYFGHVAFRISKLNINERLGFSSYLITRIK